MWDGEAGGSGPSAPPPASKGPRKRKAAVVPEPPMVHAAMSPSRIVLGPGSRRPAEEPVAPPPSKGGKKRHTGAPVKAKGGREKQVQPPAPPIRVSTGTRVSARQASRAAWHEPGEEADAAGGWGAAPATIAAPGAMPVAFAPWAGVPQPGMAPLGFGVGDTQGIGWGVAGPGDMAMAMQQQALALQMQRAVALMAQEGLVTHGVVAEGPPGASRTGASDVIPESAEASAEDAGPPAGAP